ELFRAERAGAVDHSHALVPDEPPIAERRGAGADVPIAHGDDHEAGVDAMAGWSAARRSQRHAEPRGPDRPREATPHLAAAVDEQVGGDAAPAALPRAPRLRGGHGAPR